jgi:hypothetical protein
MPAQRRQTGISKAGLKHAVLNVHRRNALRKKVEIENPIPALLQDFEDHTREVERLRRRIKEELALADMAFAKMKKFGIDGYNTIKVEDEEDQLQDDLEDYISDHSPTPPPPRRSNRLHIKTRPFDTPQLSESHRFQLPPPPEAGPSGVNSPDTPIAGPSRQAPLTIRKPIYRTPTPFHPPGFKFPPTFDPRLIQNLPYCDGCQNYGHHILYCPQAELGYPPEE